MICEECEEKITICESCGHVFAVGESLICVDNGNYHFCSSDCRTHYAQQNELDSKVKED